MKEQFQARMLRIHFGEGDKWHDKAVRGNRRQCKELGMAGAIVYRGIEGYWQQHAHPSCQPLDVFP